MYTKEQILKELSSKLTKEAILNCARNDRATPMRFLVSFIVDNYGPTEGQAEAKSQD